jgi:hypothetical protein
MTVAIPETGAPTIVGTAANMSAADKASASAIIHAFFSNALNLSGLGDWAWGKFLEGDSLDQIMLEMKQTPEYATRYPAMAQLDKEGRGISEAAYQSYENTIRALHQQYGLPTGLYDTPEQIAQGLLNNVSPAEAQFRAERAATAAYSAPDSVKAAFAQRVGVANSPSALMAAYLDDTRAIPLLEQQYAAAQVQGAAADAGAPTGAGFADTLAARGVSYAQALQGFGTVAQTQALGGGFGETVDAQTRAQAAFGDTVAQQQTQRVIKGRLAQFAGGGSLAESQTGVTGLGPSTG